MILRLTLSINPNALWVVIVHWWLSNAWAASCVMRPMASKGNIRTLALSSEFLDGLPKKWDDLEISTSDSRSA